MNVIDRIEDFSRFGSVLGLERMNVLMELLGNPQEALKVIHVAGTNGKGSVCRYIYEALCANGYKVGLFTSPFIEVFNERIEFDGKLITDEELEEISNIVLAKVEQMTKEGFDSPTEFEVITAICFLYFAKKNPDFVILEVGLGGRGDSTNIIQKPLACVITSIGYDHMDRLGNTLEEIAAEKAGIIKEGCPVVSNVEDKGAREVIARTCYEKKAELIDVTNDFRMKTVYARQTLNGNICSFVLDGIRYEDVEACMPGEHQVKNLKCALSTIEVLRRKGYISLNREKFLEGIRRARQVARFEIMQENPHIILDGAHNLDGARALADTMEKYFDKKDVLMVCGMLADKDVDGIIGQFSRIAEEFIVTEPMNARKMDADGLKRRFDEKGIRCTAYASPDDAFEAAWKRKDNYSCILFAGSLYLIGEMRRMCHDRIK